MSGTAPALNAPLTDSQKDALIKLLADDDLAIYHMIRSKIVSYGPDAAEWLKKFTLSSDAIIRRRAQEIVSYLARQNADNDFLAFCINHGEDLDLEAGVLLLARTQYPDINTSAYSALLDTYAEEIRGNLKASETAERTLAEVNDLLFQKLGFKGNEDNYYDPDNSYLNKVLDRRTGNPISLCTVYLLIARRLKLPMVGIGMPGHFLTRYQSSREEYYVDAFNKGKLLSKGDCIKYLIYTSYGFEEAHLAPITPRRMLLRVCSNLHKIYTQHNLQEEMNRFQRYIVALAK
ncbi:MAG TPA: transglutaminase-like domain-containing protein [Methylomirabilota bacterium]|nr:transglutaminase-like domain-containing protein [Methylomirabilota bacterium]